MDCLDKYQPKLEEYWPEVEPFLANLPPHLYRQGILLKNNLATFFSDTGQFKDILRRDHDYALLYFPLWLLDDFGITRTRDRDNFEKQLFLASVFAFAAGYTQLSILDEASFFDQNYLFLEHALTQQAVFHLAQLFPETSPFWPFHRAAWAEFAEAVLWEFQDHVGQVTAFEEVDLLQISGKLALGKIPVVAAVLKAGREASLDECLTMMDQLNVICQIRQDILALRRDLQRGNYTYPIVRTMQAAGINLHDPIVPERILGALVLTGAVEMICRECLDRLETCRMISKRLKLDTFSAYFDIIENLLHELRALFSIKTVKPARPAQEPSRTFFLPPLDTLSKTIEMAEGYLLSDLTFRESWEIQRRGVFNRPELVGKAFPSGLIIEILSHHGHDLGPQIEVVFQTLQQSGFRYYDHAHIPPDADDLGLLLRMCRYAPQPEAYDDLLKTPLSWLSAQVGPSGELPVWLTTPDTPAAAGPAVSLWGRRCATVDANLLLGLIDYDGHGNRALIETSAVNWLDRFTTAGLGATHHYVPLYALWTAAELIAKLAPYKAGRAWQKKIDLASKTWQACLEIETQRRKLTPQAAALLTLACLAPALSGLAKPLFRPEWLAKLFKSQRYDGSWLAEPLFGTPTRGELATWYASSSVTTAFCYHALKMALKTYEAS